MTVSTTSARVAYAGNGLTVTFTVPYYFLNSADLRLLRRTAAGAESTLATNQYTVAGAGQPVGGSVTLATALATGETLTIIRDPVIVQSTDYLANDPFPAESHERALDLLTMVGQRLDDRMDRALVLADSDTPGSGAYRAGNNRITNLAPATLSSDAVNLLQVQSLISTAGVGGGSVGGGTSDIVVPDSEVDRIIALTVIDPSLTDLFVPLNDSVGNLASQILALNATTASINTSVGTLETTVVDMQADIDLLSAISGDAANIIALITAEETARIDGDTAIAGTITKIGAAAGDNVSFILNMDTVQISPTETIGQRFEGIETQFGDLTATIIDQQTAITDGDSALAQTISKIGALTNGGAAFLIDLNTAYVGPTETLGQRFSALATSMNNNTAAISAEQTTRANADTSLASSITTLQSTVAGQTTTIQATASTVNGIQAKYTVKIDNNGYVSGYGLISTSNTGTPTSVFKVLADKFQIFNGSSPIAPFEVVGGVVYIKEANIQSLQIGKLVAGGESTFAPRAWCRMYSNSNGAFITRQANVATIVRTGTGQFTVTFATPLSSKYYVVTGCANIDDTSAQPAVFAAFNYQTTGFKFVLENFGYNYRDCDVISWQVFGSDVADTVPPTAYDPQNDPAVGGSWSRITNSSGIVP